MANEILIQPPADILVRGKSMTVPISLALDSPLKVRGIHGKFCGAEETRAVYTTTSTDSKGRVTTQTHTAVQHVEITTQEHLLSGNQRLGFLGSLSDAVATVFGGGKHDTLQPGNYSFAVEVSIPAGAPPTHKGEKTRVFYELSISVDVPAGFDLKAMQSFQVTPRTDSTHRAAPVRTRYPEDTDRGLIDALFSPDVHIEMALAADRHRLGEVIEGIFIIQPDKPLGCRGIRVRLVGIENSRANGHTDRYVHQCEAIDLGTPGTVAGLYTQEFSLPAETEAPLTARGELFSIEWFVQVELDVPWAKDPKIRAPVELVPGSAK